MHNWWHGWRLPKGGRWLTEPVRLRLPTEPLSWLSLIGLGSLLALLPKSLLFLPLIFGGLESPQLGVPTLQLPAFMALNVRAGPFAAKGDGVTDDTAAIKYALAVAASDPLNAVVFFPPGTYLISATLYPGANTQMLGTRESTIKIANNSVMGITDAAAFCAIGIQAGNVTIDSLVLDGNKAGNSQKIFFITSSGALGASNVAVQNVEIKNVQGDVTYGGCASFRYTTGVFVVNCQFHDSNSDGLSVFGQCVGVTVTNLRSYNNGILGADLEGQDAANRCTQVTLHGCVFENNAGGDVAVLNCDNVTLNGTVIKCGTVNPSENNAAVMISSSTKVTFANFTIIGPGNGANPCGINIADQNIGAFITNANIVIGPGVVTGMASDGIRMGNSYGNVHGSTNVTFVGVQSSGNGGWGLNFFDHALDTNIQLIGCNFFNNTSGAVAAGFSTILTRISYGCYPNDGTYNTLDHLGLFNIDNAGNFTTSKQVRTLSRFNDAAVALVSGVAPALDASAGDYFTLAILANIAVVIAVPTNPPAAGQSQDITIAIRNSSGGALTTPPTFNAGANGFKFSAVTNPGNGTQVEYKFRWDPVQSFWYEVGTHLAAGL